MGITDLNKKYEINEIIKGDSIFCATGITDGDLVKGVKIKDNTYYTETLVTHKNLSNNIIINKLPCSWLLIIYTIKDAFLVPSSIG